MTEPKTFKLEVDQESAGKRLDALLSEFPQIGSRSQAERLIRQQCVAVNGEYPVKSHKMVQGDLVELLMPETKPTELLPEDIDFTIVFEDEHLAVIDKPAGLVVHPAPGNESGTLVNGLVARLKDLSGIGGELRPGIVHRLDKETSGLLVVAKSDEAHRELSRALKEREVQREYIALLQGSLPWKDGDISAPIGRDTGDRKRMAVVSGGKSALTYFEVTRRFTHHTLVDVTLATGRTHQIRVHFSHLGYPVAGDVTYGAKSLPAQGSRNFLHAARLRFQHPVNGESMKFEQELPPELTGFLDTLTEQT